ncbi:hypothetical protein X777_01301 [Ooceraea biroi]|uniref:Uncharacterized protein n=1 Tax=Ooceraea biroi TaxID=2015173 RepID=A0A026WTB3_OOCBI|nr:hypothetical protein X777_01301 [Ooceraea biroi]
MQSGTPVLATILIGGGVTTFHAFPFGKLTSNNALKIDIPHTRFEEQNAKTSSDPSRVSALIKLLINRNHLHFTSLSVNERESE